MCNVHEKSNRQVGAVEEPLPLLHTSGSPRCREGWWPTAAWGWIYLTLLPQEISGEKLFLNRWEPRGFGAMKTCSKWQLLGGMAVMRSGRECCQHREVKSCSVSVPSSNQETLKWCLWRYVNIHTHTQMFYAWAFCFRSCVPAHLLQAERGIQTLEGPWEMVDCESEIKVRSVCCIFSPKYRFSFRKQIL